MANLIKMMVNWGCRIQNSRYRRKTKPKPPLLFKFMLATAALTLGVCLFGPDLAYAGDPNIFTDNVGIGTTAPTGKLHIGIGTTAPQALFVHSTTGNVGIGTTSPSEVLDVVGNITASGTITGAGLTAGGNITMADDEWIGISGSADRLIFNDTNGMGFMNGNVGIGTTAPDAELDVIGNITSSDASQSEKFGLSASTTTYTDSTAIGYNASVTGNSALAIGSNASAAYRGVALGKDADASGSQSIALGRGTEATQTSSIALGYGAFSNQANTMVIGSSMTDDPINDIYFGRGIVETVAGTYTLHATGGSGTDIAGSNLVIAGGKGTGAGAGGDIFFQTAAAGGSGSSLNSLSDRMIITDDGNVGIGTTGPSEKLEVNGAIALSAPANIKGKNEHLRFNIYDPGTVYTSDTEVCIWPQIDAAITITKIEVTCDADPTTELDIDLKWADAFIGLANAAVIDVLDTTTGTTSISSGFDDATIAASKCIYLSFGAAPDSNVKQVALDITYDYD